MRIAEYLSFVGQFKRLAARNCAPESIMPANAVPSPTFGTRSSGSFRKATASAIIHNPDVLILDEPPADLDPEQINETRDLIESLAGDRSMTLSTHILPEVSQTRELVIVNTMARSWRPTR